MEIWTVPNITKCLDNFVTKFSSMSRSFSLLSFCSLLFFLIPLLTQYGPTWGPNPLKMLELLIEAIVCKCIEMHCRQTITTFSYKAISLWNQHGHKSQHIESAHCRKILGSSLQSTEWAGRVSFRWWKSFFSRFVRLVLMICLVLVIS